MARGRPRILIIHRNNRADAAQIERALSQDARVTTIWKPDDISDLAENLPADRFDAIVLFPVTIKRRAMHEQIAMRVPEKNGKMILAVGRSGEWNGGRERVSDFCRTPMIAARTLQQHFDL